MSYPSVQKSDSIVISNATSKVVRLNDVKPEEKNNSLQTTDSVNVVKAGKKAFEAPKQELPHDPVNGAITGGLMLGAPVGILIAVGLQATGKFSSAFMVGEVAVCVVGGAIAGGVYAKKHGMAEVNL